MRSNGKTRERLLYRRADVRGDGTPDVFKTRGNGKANRKVGTTLQKGIDVLLRPSSLGRNIWRVESYKRHLFC